MNLAIILNPSSGRNRSQKKAQNLRTALVKAKISHTFFPSENEKHLLELTNRLAESKDYDVLAGMGGDSTLTLMINELVKWPHPLPFLMIGAGSSDDIVRHLKLRETDVLIRALLAQKIMEMDLLLLQAKNDFQFYVPGQANIGLGCFVNQYVPQFYKRYKWFGKSQTLAGLAGIYRAFQSKQLPVELQLQWETDGSVCHSSKKFWSVQDAVNQYKSNFDVALFSQIRYWSSGMEFAPLASLNDGLMDITLVEHGSFWDMLRIARSAGKGKILSLTRKNKVHYLQAKKIEIQGRSPFSVQVDGEMLRHDDDVLFFDHIGVKVVPRKLRVLVNPAVTIESQ